jgi:transcriptional regulator with XRE-family HTH domain
MSTKMSYFTISKKLYMFRCNKNVLLREIAKGTGLSVSFLSDIERGRTMPSLETCQKICNFYNIGLDDLFYNVKVSSSESLKEAAK